MSLVEKRSFCRICTGLCGFVLTIDEEANRITRIRGDRKSPLSNGHTCFKGLQAEAAHHGPSRLLRPLKRQPDGSFEPIESEQALDEIAARLQAILARDGGNAVAAFKGTAGTHVATNHMQDAFLAAIGSQQFFSVNTIDQSAKAVSFERQGGWGAGLPGIEQSEVVLLFGANPVVSHSTMPVFSPDPSRTLKREKARGLKLICIDPRRTETAHFADLLLQPLPGRDAAIAAAMLNLILEEGWEDREFVDRHVGTDRLAALRSAVAPFTAQRVEHAADLPAGQLRAATKLFAHDCRSGAAYASTGPSMAPYSNLMQHLVDSLNIVCGRFRRAGDTAVVDMVAPATPLHAQVIPPARSWESEAPSRIRGAGRLGIDRLTSTLAEEILTPGEDRIRAMFVLGGNPAVCIPDQEAIAGALRDLELLVVADPYLSATAQMADYVLPPTMMFERPDIPWSYGGLSLLTRTWAAYTEAVLERPPGSDLIDDWYLYWGLARRLGLQLEFFGQPVPMQAPPTTEELLAMRMANSPISLSRLREDSREQPWGRLYAPQTAVVLEALPGADAKFDVMPDDVAAEVRQLLDDPLSQTPAPGGGFTHLLATRRNGDLMNSLGNTLPSTLQRHPRNPAYLNPEELAAMGLEPGELVEIRSGHGSIVTPVAADGKLRRGVVAISHGWGGATGGNTPGVNVNQLISASADAAPINAMPRMSAVPVVISRPGSGKDATAD